MKHNEASELLYFATFELHHCMASLFFRRTFPTWTSRWSTWASCPSRWAFLCRSFQQCRWRRGQLMIVYCISLQFLSSQEGAESQSANPEKDVKKQSLIKFAKFCFAADPVYKKPCRFRFFASWCTVHAFFFLDKSVSMHFLFKNIDANKPPEHSNHPLSMSSRLSNVVDWQRLTHFSLRWGFQGHRIPLGRLEDFAQPGTMSRVAVSLCLSILFSKAVDRETSIIWRWDLSKLQNRTIRQGDHWPTDRWSLDHQSFLHIFF